MSTEARVVKIPECDVCVANHSVKPNPAYADARTWTGRWAFVCREHFRTEGCSLGTGKGQRLVKA